MPLAPKPAPPKGFNLYGYATSPLGLGEDLRAFAAMLNHLQIPFSVTDLPTESTGLVPYAWEHMTTLDYENAVFFMSPMECMALSKIHPQLFSQPKTTIGYFLWELPDFPNEFLPALKLVKHIWCPSKFVQQAFMAKAKQLTLCLPLPVMQPPAAGFDFREHFKIPEDAFVVLFMFDIHSTLARKNPQACVQAFLEFAKNKPNVFLILKIGRWQNREDTDLSWLPEDPHIKLVTETLLPEHVTDLYQAANCYLSLHRSEGFGRTLIEALQNNLKLITCNYSGPADFLTPQNSHLVSWQFIDVLPGQYPHAHNTRWANPSIAESVAQLEVVYQEHQKDGAVKSRAAGDFFGVANLAKRYAPIITSYLK